jgi:hypothetical protein
MSSRPRSLGGSNASVAAEIRQPLTLAAGDASWLAYRAACDRLQALIPRSDVITIRRQHLYPLASPDDFAAFVVARARPARS